MEFENIQDQPAKIKVIGVGGGGGHAVNHMFDKGIKGVDFIVCNTDAQDLSDSPVPTKISLGTLGAGNIPERAQKRALDYADDIRKAISNDTQMLFITAGMGGGTGTGAAPVIAKIAKEIELEDEWVSKILVVAIVTMPFKWEGATRRSQAEKGLAELKSNKIDALLVINNDKLRSLGGNLPLRDSFKVADDVLFTAVKGIAEIITNKGQVNIDFRDVNTVMENSGTALMGTGVGKGESRARQAVEAATTSVLLNDNDIRGSKNMLLYFTTSPDYPITMDEVTEITDYITSLVGNTDATIIWGNGEDESLEDELKITLVATGFEERPSGSVTTLEPASSTDDNTGNNFGGGNFGGGNKGGGNNGGNNGGGFNGGNNGGGFNGGGFNGGGNNGGGNNGGGNNGGNGPSASTNNTTKKGTVYILGDNMNTPNEPKQSPEKQNMSEEEKMLEEIRIRTANSSIQSNNRSQNNPVSQQTDTIYQDGININVRTIENEVYGPDPINRPTSNRSGSQNVRNTAEEQLKKAITPIGNLDDSRIKERANIVREIINKALHDEVNGPQRIEDLDPSKINEEAIYETIHSSVNEAAQSTMTTNGIFSNDLKDLYTTLPD